MTDQYVLVVDDDPAFSHFTQNLLTDREMRVVVASSKAEGLEEFKRELPSCVILDIFLPDGSGVDLIKPMRAASLTMPIIMVSGQSEVDEVVRAMKEGASDYVKKPFQGRNSSSRCGWCWMPPTPRWSSMNCAARPVRRRSTTSSSG